MASETTTIHTLANIPYHCTLNRPAAASRGTILLLHALMADSTMWDSTVAALTTAFYMTLRVDYIGHGRTPVPSPAPGGSMTAPALHFNDVTRHMHDLLVAATGSEQVYAVIGCSMGGVLALRYALLYPATVDPAGGIISCDAPGPTALESAKPLWSDRIAQLKADVAAGTDTLARATVERWIPFPPGRDGSSDPETVAAREKALRMTRAVKVDGYRVCADGIRSYDYEGFLGSVKARTMVLVGSLDGAVGPRSVTEGIAKSIPGARYVWMEGAGHVPPLHRPGEFEGIVLEFLEERGERVGAVL